MQQWSQGQARPCNAVSIVLVSMERVPWHSWALRAARQADTVAMPSQPIRHAVIRAPFSTYSLLLCDKLWYD
jgi:hypothetical protein